MRTIWWAESFPGENQSAPTFERSPLKFPGGLGIMTDDGVDVVRPDTIPDRNQPRIADQP
jgi:hypothetical protein